MTEFSDVLLKGGPVALIVAAAFAVKYIIEGFTQWRRSKSDDSTATVTDAATTNAMLLSALQSEREEASRKDRRIDELELEVDHLRNQVFEQRRMYETEIADLRRKLANFTLQLEELQARIRAGLPPQ